MLKDAHLKQTEKNLLKVNTPKNCSRRSKVLELN